MFAKKGVRKQMGSANKWGQTHFPAASAPAPGEMLMAQQAAKKASQVAKVIAKKWGRTPFSSGGLVTARDGAEKALGVVLARMVQDFFSAGLFHHHAVLHHQHFV